MMPIGFSPRPLDALLLVYLLPLVYASGFRAFTGRKGSLTAQVLLAIPGFALFMAVLWYAGTFFFNAVDPAHYVATAMAPRISHTNVMAWLVSGEVICSLGFVLLLRNAVRTGRLR
jgi:hypothetical protein